MVKRISVTSGGPTVPRAGSADEASAKRYAPWMVELRGAGSTSIRLRLRE
ncbi:hypothetical protein FHR81_002750 [Actinoalloteichus hoggarensis]|uniref:Uncharacterized protein n=1 Tax=Actinoalloteichus hoggarensis TaxID=1470176 RepID=A0A221VXZ9_9PSEU|nr:hypothetical protein [Actinoalloteichus hoggarensis]ASO18347.1 hypothetical protein AHOG_03445 [Actinoalloteichus hoggarensis]MBB5921710.1 hypothetical protein [Actinoalloteichus hoggarensis]